jgi:hypothetical protein
MVQTKIQTPRKSRKTNIYISSLHPPFNHPTLTDGLAFRSLVDLDFLLEQTFKRNIKVNKGFEIPAGIDFLDENSTLDGQSLKVFFHHPPSFLLPALLP